jgi:hypothetical protein
MSTMRALVLLIAGAITASTPARGQVDTGELSPVQPPFKTGYLKASGVHEISYALHGNPKGKPVFVLHGGPGFGCYPRLVQYFDPEK